MSQEEANRLNEEAAERSRKMKQVREERRTELERMQNEHPKKKMVWKDNRLVFAKSGRKVPNSKIIEM